ncbi:MAG: hypothetical protein ACAI38_11780 [Myxococcota bacterium]|nr:hypothetical protein [Myxococcota bacterium]
MVARVAIALLLGCTACGGEEPQILLELTSERLPLPGGLDSIAVRSHGIGEAEARLEVVVDVSASHAYPIVLLLTPTEGTPSPLVHEIECFAAETRVCALAVTHPWRRDEVSRARVSLDPP